MKTNYVESEEDYVENESDHVESEGPASDSFETAGSSKDFLLVYANSDSHFDDSKTRILSKFANERKESNVRDLNSAAASGFGEFSSKNKYSF